MVKQKNNKLIRGTYTVELYIKGKNEFMFNNTLKDGDVFYTVWNDKGCGFDTLSQDNAIIMSTQIRIEDKLNELLDKINSYEKDINITKIKEILKML